jgi:hypothetical protein
MMDMSPARPTIEERAATFHAANPHVLAEMLRLARELLDRGAKYIGAKALWESLRVSLSTTDNEYRLNNSFTSIYARMAIDHEPRLGSVMELRRRKTP